MNVGQARENVGWANKHLNDRFLRRKKCWRNIKNVGGAKKNVGFVNKNVGKAKKLKKKLFAAE